MRATGRTITGKDREPTHLPELPVEPEAYQQLYSFNCGVDDYMEETADWQTLRIPPGLPEEEVYRRLPAAPDFEYGGYLTKSRIRFLKCDEDRASTRMSRSCTFHSHPTDSPYADLPSMTDVYSFLAFRHVRAVTVGATQLWVFDKTKATLAIVQKLATWAEANQLQEVRRLEKEAPHAWQEPYMRLVLKKLGLVWPNKRQGLERDWPEMLQSTLQVRVRVFPRTI
ncbi:MAG: hypothetical protein ACK4RK_16545 [Gemmataceae bacterium]